MDKSKAGNTLYLCSCRGEDNINKFKNIFLTNTLLMQQYRCVIINKYCARQHLKDEYAIL